MEKFIIIISLIILFSSCSSNKDNKANENFNIAEQYIEDMQPQKAIPYLKKIKPNDPNYKEAKELLNTIKVFSIKEEKEETEKKLSKNDELFSKEIQEKIILFQKKWAKSLIKSYDGYLTDYLIKDNVITFILSKEASESGTIEVHEKYHIDGFLDNYYEQLKKEKLPDHKIVIHLKKKDGISNPNLCSSTSGWLPAEYVWVNVTLYYGTENEKRYVGKVIKGTKIDGVKYLLIKIKSGSIENKDYDYITHSAFYIKKSDPYIKTKLINFK